MVHKSDQQVLVVFLSLSPYLTAFLRWQPDTLPVFVIFFFWSFFLVLHHFSSNKYLWTLLKKKIKSIKIISILINLLFTSDDGGKNMHFRRAKQRFHKIKIFSLNYLIISSKENFQFLVYYEYSINTIVPTVLCYSDFRTLSCH